MSKTAKKEERPTFEASLEKLESIVHSLETGDKGLEESLAIFEQGVTLAKALTAQLDEAKRRVEVLTKEGGKLSRQPMEPAQG